MKQKLKAIVSLLGVFAVSIILASCSIAGGEEGDVRDAVDETMKIFKFAENSDTASFADQNTIDTLNAYGVDANTFLGYCFKNLEWEIGEVNLSGYTGTVTVSITNVNLGAALDQAGDKFAAFSETDEAHQLFDEKGESALVEKLFDFFYEIVDSGTLSTSTNEVTIDVHKTEDGVWEVDPDNDSLYRALFGGANLNF